ncbi:MAG TPA: outer membrane beta-barrel protein [Thermoanaerobaculia bacterium]|nr:outer membrane beta-barrel protein [Thermoanaerobaculia bacterium]
MRKLLFAILLLVPGTAFAQGAGFEITPTAGYRFTGSVTAYDNEGVRQGRDLKVDSGGMYGVTFDVPIGYRWQLEFMANHQSTSFQLDRGIFTPRTDLGDVDLDYYQVGLAYNWGRGQVNPFFGGSVGISNIKPKLSAVPSDNHFAGTLFGGVKVFFNRNVGLRLEARGYWSNIDTGINTGGHQSNRNNEALYQGEGSAGLILAW